MAMTYEIDAAARMITLRITGDVTSDDAQRYFKSSRDDPAFSLGLNRLVIAIGVTSFPPADEVTALAAEIRRRTAERDVRFAVVADSPLAIGMANMFLGQSGLTNRYAMFDSEEAARTWLRG